MRTNILVRNTLVRILNICIDRMVCRISVRLRVRVRCRGCVGEGGFECRVNMQLCLGIVQQQRQIALPGEHREVGQGADDRRTRGHCKLGATHVLVLPKKGGVVNIYKNLVCCDDGGRSNVSAHAMLPFTAMRLHGDKPHTPQQINHRR